MRIQRITTLGELCEVMNSFDSEIPRDVEEITFHE